MPDEKPPNDLNAKVLDELSLILNAPHLPRSKLDASLRLLAKWRSVLIQNTLLKELGPVVQAGPFSGMRYLQRVTEGCFAPKLLGSYESALHPYIESAIRTGYPTVVNLGSAEGYYAVGFARCMPRANVFAVDRDKSAREACQSLANINGVADRVTILADISAIERLLPSAESRCLVFCDIEGEEVNTIDPVRHVWLRKADIIVEVHEKRGETELMNILVSRFSDSHASNQVMGRTRDIVLPQTMDSWADLDRLLAVWEWRSSPTPWLVLTSKESDRDPVATE